MFTLVRLWRLRRGLGGENSPPLPPLPVRVPAPHSHSEEALADCQGLFCYSVESIAPVGCPNRKWPPRHAPTLRTVAARSSTVRAPTPQASARQHAQGAPEGPLRCRPGNRRADACSCSLRPSEAVPRWRPARRRPGGGAALGPCRIATVHPGRSFRVNRGSHKRSGRRSTVPCAAVGPPDQVPELRPGDHRCFLGSLVCERCPVVG